MCRLLLVLAALLLAGCSPSAEPEAKTAGKNSVALPEAVSSEAETGEPVMGEAAPASDAWADAEKLNLGEAKPDIVAFTLSNLPVTTASIKTLAFSPDGSSLAIGNGAGQVLIWDVEKKEIAKRLPGHQNWVFDLVYDADGQRLITGGGDNLIHVLDPETSEVLQRIDHHSDDLHGVGVTSDGRCLVSGADDRSVKLWDLEQQESLELGTHDEQVTAVVISPDDRWAASASRDDSVRLWDLQERKEVARLDGHTDDVMQIQFHPQGDMLLSVSYDGTARLWNVPDGSLQKEVRITDGRVYDAVFSRDGTHFWAITPDDFLVQFSTEGGLETQNWKLPQTGSALALSRDGNRLAVGTIDGTFEIFTFSNQTAVKREEHRVGPRPAGAPK